MFKTFDWKNFDDLDTEKKVFHMYDKYLLNSTKPEAAQILYTYTQYSTDSSFIDEVLSQLTVYKKEFQREFLKYMFEHSPCMWCKETNNCRCWATAYESAHDHYNN